MTDIIAPPAVEPLDVPVLPTEPEPDPVLAILRGGRDAVRRGWCKHYGRDPHGNVCALGGLLADTTSEYGSRREALTALVAALPPGYHAVSTFNDSTSTTKADVVALYDRAIEARKRSR